MLPGQEGVIRLDYSRYWIVQLVFETNRAGTLPTLEDIRTTFRGHDESGRIRAWLGMGRSVRSVLEAFRSHGFIEEIVGEGGVARYFVTEEGQSFLRNVWQGISDTARKTFFGSNETVTIPIMPPAMESVECGD